MIRGLSSLSKISRPSIAGISPRLRLFELLDKGDALPVTWVSGPAGSGKTTLIASYLDSRRLPCIWYQVDEGDSDIATFFYCMGLAARKAAPRARQALPLLTPEYLLGVSTFARRFFEKLFLRLKPPFALVFDNYQEVSPDSGFHEVIREALSAVPAGVRIVAVSRAEPPPALVRHRANGKIHFAGWSDIRFNLEEFREMSKARGLDLNEDTLKQLHGKTEGWVAGLVLLAEKPDGMGHALCMPEKGGLANIFDYFASELFEKAEPELQAFLLKTAFFTRMTSGMAARLTNNPRSDDILASLNRLHYFTEKNTFSDPVYQYHALFREFLLSRAASVFSESEMARIQRESAELLTESGHFEDAANMLSRARDWAGLAKLILSRAVILTKQGRSKTLEEWISRLPRGVLENTPWLLYWRGVCRMSFNLQEGRKYFDRAYAFFEKQKDIEGLYLSWSGVVETYIHEWNDYTPLDHWIAEGETLLRDHPAFPSPEIEGRVIYAMFGALMYRRPAHPDFPAWEERARGVAFTSIDLQLKTAMVSLLILYYSWWAGDLSKARMLMKSAKPAAYLRDTSPFVFIIRRSMEAAYLWMNASNKECIEAVHDCLATSEASGAHVWDPMVMALGVLAGLTSGKLDDAQLFLDRMSEIASPSALLLAEIYHYMAAFVELARGDLAAAREHAEHCYPLGMKGGTPLGIAGSIYTLGAVLVEQGERTRGLACLRETAGIASEANIKTFEYQALMSEAQYFLEQREEAASLEALAKAMSLGKEKGFVNHTSWRSSVMSRLCAKALEAGIETGHIRSLIRKRELSADPEFYDVRDWPWPVKIHTLGTFEIVVNGRALSFSGKVQKKPIELIKMLASLGPGTAREDTVMDLLWPDKDGDAAHDSLKMTVSRLRKMIGDAKAIQVQDGLIRFNSGQVWVDARAFENRIKKIELLRGGPESRGDAEIADMATAALDLYKGHFLPVDAAVPWTASTRERLRGKFISLVNLLGPEIERSGQWRQAAELYSRAIEIDTVSEDFYRKLMACYARLGRNADVILVYRRCRSMLTESFGIPPSRQTEEVLRAAVGKENGY